MVDHVCRWKHKFSPGQATSLELGLANKREGLEAMRRERLPSVRMYDIAEYYYKARPCSSDMAAHPARYA